MSSLLYAPDAAVGLRRMMSLIIRAPGIMSDALAAAFVSTAVGGFGALAPTLWPDWTTCPVSVSMTTTSPFGPTTGANRFGLFASSAACAISSFRRSKAFAMPCWFRA